MKSLVSTIILVYAAVAGCSSSKNESSTQEEEVQPTYTLTFNQDSALKHIRHQVEMGPRVPGSEAHQRCERFIMRKMRKYGADTIIEQKGTLTAFNGDVLPFNNILAKFNEEQPRRILIAAHYDTRPWADNEKNEHNRNTPIVGANDGGSGVGVIIELARVIGESDLPIGVDFLLVDVEDYGNSNGWGMNEDTWCLGSQYWAENNPYTDADRPEFGIVLDMVGGTNARFHREYFSTKSANQIVDKVWGIAANSGYSDIFINEIGGSIIDDHIYINRAGIPCIDIVECNNIMTRTFPPTWHTLHDNMAAIDGRPLKAVGNTVLRVIESESKKN